MRIRSQMTSSRSTPRQGVAKWEDYGFSHALYVNGLGRVIGELKEGWRRWECWYENKSLGDYTDADSAKKAVERAHKARKK